MDRINRRKSGQALVVLCALISLMIVLVVGLFSYEVNRVEVCRAQLRSAAEAAALAAAATLASQDNTDPTQAQDQAIQTALNTFAQNSVAGTGLTGASLTYTDSDSPLPEHSSLFIQFLDPNNNMAPVTIGDPNGKVVNVTAAFGLVPSFGTFLGLPTVPLRCSANGGVPDMDVVLCFDVSGSMDDQTPVTMVKRQWAGSGNNGKIQYVVPQTQAGAKAGPLAQGRIYDIIGPLPVGTGLQALPPQNLSQVEQTGIRWPLKFSESGAAVGLRGQSDNSPPGNMPPGTAGTGDKYTMTDLVVNIDGNTTFQGLTTSDGYAFPDVATLVEAARGNLEDATVFAQSKANTGVPSNVLPRAGYKAKYLQMARATLHPIADSQSAAETFFTIMNTNTIGHFSLVCFSSNAGNSPSSSTKATNVDWSYPAGGTGNFPYPLIALNPATGATNYTQVENTLPVTTAISGTNIGDALNTAVNQLSANARPGSKKAIVLFTDGMPTVGGPLNSDPAANARAAAARAQAAGIPIYSIGLAQNPEIIPFETNILNDTNSNSSTGGVSGIAGHGGKFFLVTDVANLRHTFENIARQLVQLLR
jgi:hypothetical protein